MFDDTLDEASYLLGDQIYDVSIKEPPDDWVALNDPAATKGIVATSLDIKLLLDILDVVDNSEVCFVIRDGCIACFTSAGSFHEICTRISELGNKNLHLARERTFKYVWDRVDCEGITNMVSRELELAFGIPFNFLHEAVDYSDLRDFVWELLDGDEVDDVEYLYKSLQQLNKIVANKGLPSWLKHLAIVHHLSSGEEL